MMTVIKTGYAFMKEEHGLKNFDVKNYILKIINCNDSYCVFFLCHIQFHYN